MACRPWVAVAVLLVPISACATGTVPPVSGENTPYSVITEGATLESSQEAPLEAPKAAKSFWPWSSKPVQQPPPVKAYKLPTMAGDDLPFRDKPAALVKATPIDADAIYQYVLDCYPETSKWKLDVNLRGQLSTLGTDFLASDAGNTELGSNYVAIVANMPLYSSTEINREKEREHLRRQDVATTVSSFMTAIASRNHSIRELALYRSLEARSALRVQQGIVDASEQVKYLEKVAGSQESLLTHHTKITETRLKLASFCDARNATAINQWLQKVSTVPMKETSGLPR